MARLLLLLIASLASAVPTAAAGQDGPSLDLAQVSPQEAFARLGMRDSARFELVEGQEWVGPEAGVTVTADLRELSFWEAVLKIGDQTGYEPVFLPYGRTDDGLPVIRLRRVDVKGEEKPTPAVAAGPVLLRSREAYVTVPLELAQIRMVPMQAGVRTEVFLEPGSPTVYVTAAALRALDEEGAEFRRAEGFDPTTAIEDGVGELEYRLDVVKRVPLAIEQWRALLRVVQAGEAAQMRVPVTVVPEEPPSTQRASLATTQATTQAAAGGALTPASLGPYRLGLAPVRVGEREAAGDLPARRVATVRLAVPRGELDHTAWSRLYGFLVSLPPSLSGGDQDRASPWELAGYAVVSSTDAADAEVASGFSIWARFEAEAGAEDPAWLEWELPVSSDEQRVGVTWGHSLPIEGRGPTTRKARGRRWAGRVRRREGRRGAFLCTEVDGGFTLL